MKLAPRGAMQRFRWIPAVHLEAVEMTRGAEGNGWRRQSVIAGVTMRPSPRNG
jgi:hypothetical protein